MASTVLKNFLNPEANHGDAPESFTIKDALEGAVIDEPCELFDIYEDVWHKDGNLLVKVQAQCKSEDRSDGSSVTVQSPDHDLRVYNESRNFQCMLDSKKLDAVEFLSIMREKAIGGTKGYFWAFMEKGKSELVIITDPILPAQSW